MVVDFKENSPAVEVFLLGQLDFDRCFTFQQQLLEQIACRDDGQITLLLCEHPRIITVGRRGSPADIASDNRLLTSGEIEVRWVNRGGGCLLHSAGQLAIYPLVPLRWHGFTVGEYVRRLLSGIVNSLDELGIRGETPPGRFGIWGRTGQLAALGVAVRRWVTYYGAYLNVCPTLGLFRLVESDPVEHSRMSSLISERCGPVRMETARAALIRRLAEAFGCDRYHLYTGHPLLRENAKRTNSD
jgi:lipoyl(octanoyl) transferase